MSDPSCIDLVETTHGGCFGEASQASANGGGGATEQVVSEFSSGRNLKRLRSLKKNIKASTIPLVGKLEKF